MKTLLTAARLLLPDGEIKNGALLVNDGKIERVGPQSEFTGCDCPVRDYGGHILSPGFFDLHVHGCMGQLCDESSDAVHHLSRYLITTGTTRFLATAMSEKGCANAKAAIDAQKEKSAEGAEIAGIYMEGPFLSPRGLAGTDGGDSKLVAPTVEALEKILETGGGHVKLMGLGVEREGAAEVIQALKQRGIVASLAHSNAGYDDALAAIEQGISHTTHLYNLMTGLHHRRPGAVGAVLRSDTLTTELICDGVHLHPAAIEVALRCVGADRAAMITDMTLGGLPDGDYSNAEFTIEVRDSVARFSGVDPAADHAIAGSTRPMLAGIRTVLGLGRPLYEAVRMASLTPARIAGLDNNIGSLQAGKDADVTVFSEDLQVVMTMLRGEIKFEAGL